jgi:hypothetical protein
MQTDINAVKLYRRRGDACNRPALMLLGDIASDSDSLLNKLLRGSSRLLLASNAAVTTDAIIANAAVTSRSNPVVNRAAASPTDRPAWNGDSRTV